MDRMLDRPSTRWGRIGFLACLTAVAALASPGAATAGARGGFGAVHGASGGFWRPVQTGQGQHAAQAVGPHRHGHDRVGMDGWRDGWGDRRMGRRAAFGGAWLYDQPRVAERESATVSAPETFNSALTVTHIPMRLAQGDHGYVGHPQIIQVTPRGRRAR